MAGILPTDSQRLANRSYRRVERMGNREEGKELYTADPAALEVAIAQVDATLAVAMAIGEANQEIALLRRQVEYSGNKPGVHFRQTAERDQIDALGRRIKNIQDTIHDIIAQMDKQHPSEGHNPASPRPNPNSPWWAIWNQFRRKE